MDGMYPLLGLALAKEIQRDRLVAAEAATRSTPGAHAAVRQGQPAGPDVEAVPRPAGRPGASDGSLAPRWAAPRERDQTRPASYWTVPSRRSSPSSTAGCWAARSRPERDDWVELEVDGHTLAFQKVQSYEPPSWPDGPPQQFHLDLLVEGYAGTHELVISLGRDAPGPRRPAAGGERAHLAGVRRPGRPPVLPLHVLTAAAHGAAPPSTPPAKSTFRTMGSACASVICPAIARPPAPPPGGERRRSRASLSRPRDAS